jgi:hypothetical protein
MRSAERTAYTNTIKGTTIAMICIISTTFSPSSLRFLIEIQIDLRFTKQKGNCYFGKFRRRAGPVGFEPTISSSEG